MQNTENFYCYSLRLFHYLNAFDEKCSASRISKTSGNRYWVFKKSDRLDKIIQSYNATKHNFN